MSTFDNVNWNVKYNAVKEFIEKETPLSIYQDPENYQGYESFFQMYRIAYVTKYKWIDNPLHFKIFIMLVTHLNIDRDEVYQKFLEEDIIEFAFEQIEDTDFVAGYIS